MLVVLNQECCGSGQYNLPDRILRLNANTTLNQSYVLFIALVNITYQSGDQYLPSIHFWDSSPWQVLYIPLLLITFFSFLPHVVLNCLSCSAYILQTCINLTSFVFKLKFISFLICDFAHLLSYYYYYHNYCFYYYFLLIFCSACFVLLLFLIFIV